ncbi:hypothetical protein AU476_15145 [Cupriavidus sp. UYMSc13B]|nr:hypothetical protein AU476_15145 [Cupriavidus sp. UYMSc13B]
MVSMVSIETDEVGLVDFAGNPSKVDEGGARVHYAELIARSGAMRVPFAQGDSQGGNRHPDGAMHIGANPFKARISRILHSASK